MNSRLKTLLNFPNLHLVELMCIKKGHYRREDAVPGGHYETLLNKPELCAWN